MAARGTTASAQTGLRAPERHIGFATHGLRSGECGGIGQQKEAKGHFP